MLRSEFSRHGLTFLELPWTSANKPQAVERVRRWMREGSLVLPDTDTRPGMVALRRELAAFQERLAPSGQLTFGARSGGHDDHVALLLTAALAEAAGFVPSSPLAPRIRRGSFIPTP